MRTTFRFILLLLALSLLGLQYRLRHGVGSLPEVAELQQRVAKQRLDNAELTQRNATLSAEVQDLKSGTAAVEERARQELGMIKPDEVFYRVVEERVVEERQP